MLLVQHPWVQNLLYPWFQKISLFADFFATKGGLNTWKNNTYMIYHDLPSFWKVDRSWFDDELVNINTSPPNMCSSKHQTKKHLQFNSPSKKHWTFPKHVWFPSKSINIINIMFILKICKDHVHQGNPPKKSWSARGFESPLRRAAGAVQMGDLARAIQLLTEVGWRPPNAWRFSV